MLHISHAASKLTGDIITAGLDRPLRVDHRGDEAPRFLRRHTLSGLSRRTLLALPFAIGLSACSLAQTEMVLEVEPDSLSAFVDAITWFAGENDYELRKTGPGVLGFSYEGPHASMAVSQFEPGMFRVVFEAMPPEFWEWLFDFGPDVDSVAADFRRVVLRVDGVREHETRPPPA